MVWVIMLGGVCRGGEGRESRCNVALTIEEDLRKTNNDESEQGKRNVIAVNDSIT